MIKTIEAYNIEEFDARVNDFVAENGSYATQTHTTYRPIHDQVLYTAVIYYNPKPKV